MEEMNTVMNEVVNNEAVESTVEDAAMNVAEKLGDAVQKNGFAIKDLLIAGAFGAAATAVVIFGAKPAKRAITNFMGHRNIVKPGSKKKSKPVDKDEVVDGEASEIDEPEENAEE